MADSAADIDAHPHPDGGALQTAKDLFSGAAGGVAQVLLGKETPCLKHRKMKDSWSSFRGHGISAEFESYQGGG